MYIKGALLAVVATAAAVSAHNAHLFERGTHNEVTLRYLRRANVMSAADLAKVQDPNQQCSYNLNAANMPELKQGQPFPQSWKIASIQDNDQQAKKVWQDIQSSGIIPGDVQVKSDGGQHNAVSQNGYNSHQDPDCWWTASGCVTPKHQNIPSDLASCPEPNTWGLTFDDGPNCSHNAFYDFLSQNKLKATMFFIGSNAKDWPLQTQRAIVDGHDLCVHTWSHHYMTTLSNDQAFAELYYTAVAIKAITGVTPTCWRPPFGDVDDRIRAIAAGLGLRTILWEADTDDWNISVEGKDKIDQNYQKIFSEAGQKNPIVLTHEIDNSTMSEFMGQYNNIKNAYKNVVPVSACQNVTNPYPEDITYPTFNQFLNGQAAQGLPDGNTIKVDPQFKYNVIALADQKAGFANPKNAEEAAKVEQKQSGNSSNASQGSISDNSNKNSKSSAGTTLGSSSATFSALLAVFMIFMLSM